MSRRTPRSTQTPKKPDPTPNSLTPAPAHTPKSSGGARSSTRAKRPSSSAAAPSPLSSADGPSSPVRPRPIRSKRTGNNDANGSGSMTTPRASGSTDKAPTKGRTPGSVARRGMAREVDSGDEDEAEDEDIGASSTAKRRRLNSPAALRHATRASPTPDVDIDSSDEYLSEDVFEVLKKSASQTAGDAEEEARAKKERRARRQEERQLKLEEEEFVQTELPVLTASDKRKHPLLVRSSGNWFPAYLVDFEPVRSVHERRAGKVDQWKVHIHPSESKRELVKKEKDIMYLEDDRIADCAWPRIESFDEDIARSDALTRDVTPPPRPDPTPTPFAELDRREQLYLLRPHLQTLIAEAYPPAQWRIDAFFRGESKRLEKPHNKARGDIVENEVVSIIHPELQRWTLREATPSVTPPSGSDRFNALDVPGKRSYIELVLEPETCVGLCVRYMSIQELAQAELERRGADADDGAAGAAGEGEDEDEDANGVESWASLAPGVEPPSAKRIPTPLLRAAAAAAAEPTDVPNWAVYTLARQQLVKTTNAEAQERQLWIRLVAQCKEARVAARIRLGLFDPYETMGKEERRRAELAKQGKTLSSSGRMTNRALGMAETVAEKNARRAARRR